MVDIGHIRARDLALELPPVPLEAVMANDVWELVYDRMAALAGEHRTTLVFVNTRRMAERAARHLADRLGTEAVAAHHGSLAKEHRLLAEQRLKRGELKVLVATASLELGIDIGDVELVCQSGLAARHPRSCLQRGGRAGHHVGRRCRGAASSPTSRDDLAECARAAGLRAARRAGYAAHPARAAGRAGPADRGRGVVPRMARGRAVRDDPAGRALRGAAARALRRGDAHVDRRPPWGRHGQRAVYLHRDTVSGTVRGRRGGTSSPP